MGKKVRGGEFRKFIQSETVVKSLQFLIDIELPAFPEEIFLKRYNAKSLVIGHTPQDNINSIDNGLIWRVDCGMSDAFGIKNNDFSKVQVLQIINNGRKINIL